MFELTSILFLFSTVQLSNGIGLLAGPVGFYDIIELTSCKCPNGCTGAINMYIHKDGNVKSLKGNVTLPTDYDQTYSFTLNVDRWSGSEWKKDYMKLGGSSCDNVAKVAPNIQKNLMAALRPKVPDVNKCLVKAGTYTFENVKCQASDVKVPTMMYSKYRGTVLINKGKDEISCLSATVIVQQ